MISIGQYTKKLKAILRKDGISIFRKEGEKLQQEAKRRIKKKEKKKKENEREEGLIYKINCKDCVKIYIGETKFTMKNE